MKGLKKNKQQKSKSTDSKLKENIYLLAIIIFVYLIYFISLKNDFIINWDDHLYVTENDMIKDFSWKGIKTIFSTFHYENYHPLTNLSNAIEYRFFGLNPLPYHLFNLFLHLLNVGLVFRLMKLFSRRKEIAIISSLFFGIHPMHVESVARISERKDLLYACFYLLSLIYYLQYIQKKKHITLYYALFSSFYPVYQSLPPLPCLFYYCW